MTETSINVAQLNNYKTWINTHLKKRPGVKLVENLQSDISDGVALIHLIEVISGCVLPDVNLNPKSLTDSKENIEKVLKFMQSNSVKVQRTTTKEILEGNIKSIMRVILALAAHFKPTNVQQNPNSDASNQKKTSSCTNLNTNKNLINKHYAQSTNNLHSTTQTLGQRSNLNQTRTLDTMTHLVQAACVSIADVRRYGDAEKNFNVKYVKRNNLNSQNNIEQPVISNKFNINNKTYIAQSSESSNKLREDRFSNRNHLVNSMIMSPSMQQRPLANSTVLNLTTSVNNDAKNKMFSDNEISLISAKTDYEPGVINNSDTIIISDKGRPEQSNENPVKFLDDLNENIEDVKAVKEYLLNLHNLLMKEDLKIEANELQTDQVKIKVENNYYNDDNNVKQENDDYALSDLAPEEQVTILRNKIHQLENLCHDLREELNQNNYLSLHQVGEGKGLKTRLNEQNNTILEMKTEQLDSQLANQKLLKENDELKNQYQNQLDLTNSLKEKILYKDEAIRKLESEIRAILIEKNEIINLNGHDKVESPMLKQKENVLMEIANNQDTNSKNDSTFIKPNKMNSQGSDQIAVTSETEQILKEALNQVRVNFKSNQFTIQLLNSLEKEIKSISNKLVKKSVCLKINKPYESVSNNSSKTLISKMEGATSISSTTSTCSSSSSSVTSSSANSPVLSVTSLSSSNNHLISSSSVEKSKNYISNQLNTTNSLVNNEGHVKKIISRFQKVDSSNKFRTDPTESEENYFYNNSNNSSSTNHTKIDNNDKIPDQLSNPSIEHTASTSKYQSSHMNDQQPLKNQTDTIKKNTAKCIYYLNKQPQPYHVTITKNIEDISLYDFKANIKLDTSTNYRFFFKTQEPEFGFLKEEIINDDKILPCFENRIVAWIEEST